jgi:hypothetical protein
MSLHDEIIAAGVANPTIQGYIDNQEHGLLAAALSVARTAPRETAIGIGTILDTLGVSAGNSFLDVINSVTDYRWIKIVVNNGKFDISKPLSQGSVQAMVPDIITQPQADALIALGRAPATVGVQEVINALKGN